MAGEDQYEKIERYLSNAMSKEERIAFEAEMKEQPTLAQEVALHREIGIAIGDEEEQEIVLLRNKIDATVAQHRSAKTRKLTQFRPLAIAASILIIGLIGLLIFQHSNAHLSADELYQAYVKLPNDLAHTSSVRGNEAATTSLYFSDFYQFYQSQNYTAALAELDKLSQTNTDFIENNPSQYYYYQGITYLQLMQIEQAQSSFQQVESNHQEAANWYLALINLRIEGCSDRTENALFEISKSSSAYAAKAKKVLKKFPC